MQSVESGSLTEGYRRKSPLFHKLFLSSVEKGDGVAAIGLLWVAIEDRRLVCEKTRPEAQLYNRTESVTRVMHWHLQPATSARNFFQSLLVDVEVRMHVLHVFAIFERFHQADHLRRLLSFQLDVGIRNHAHA